MGLRKLHITIPIDGSDKINNLIYDIIDVVNDPKYYYGIESADIDGELIFKHNVGFVKKGENK